MVAPGAAGAWDDHDRTSPVVIHDGERLVMLFEGRTAGNVGIPAPPDGIIAIGRAVSEDEGLTWQIDPTPMIDQAGHDSGRWNARGVCAGDIIRAGDSWVLLVAGQDDGHRWTNVGRFITQDPPSQWTAASWTEMAGNPMVVDTPSVMFWGNDLTRGVRWASNNQSFQRVRVVPRSPATGT